MKGWTRSSRGSRRPRRRKRSDVELTAENTAIVVDSTADFPEATQRFPNWRVGPLYVRFGDQSFPDNADFGPAPPPSRPARGAFRSAYEELAGYERILSVHIAGKLSGTIESARAAASEL